MSEKNVETATQNDAREEKMKIYFEEPDIQIQEFEYDDTLESDGKSLSQFCQFVEYYTCYSTAPLCTDTLWEKAEEVRLTPHDVNPESIYRLMETMLVAIEHLEKKRLDEQRQYQDSEQKWDKIREQGGKHNRLKQVLQTWIQRVQNRFVQSWQMIMAGPTL
jgi:hypothetical protein